MKISILFFGSGPVAAKSLELLAKNFSIEAVVTKPKPEHHKGDFPVIEVAKKLGLKTYTVSNKVELSELIAASPFKSSLGVLVDFGIIVTQDVIDYFPKGIVNSHFSLLPEWRGADPITFSILSGQKRTGVSLMLLVEKMDEGPLLAFGIQELDGTETTPDLTEKLIYLSDALLKEEIPRYLADGKLVDQSQIAEQVPGYPSKPTYSRKLTKEDGRIDWNKPARQIEREIRAFSEWPKSFTKLAGVDVIIMRVHAIDSNDPKIKPGGQTIVDERLLIVQTGDGSLIIDELRPAGKTTMDTKAFLAGYGKKLNN